MADGREQQQQVIPDFAFSERWQVLGPFQVGTREALWGSDPLQYYHGGFHALQYDPQASFKSSLAPNATVSWSNRTARLSDPDVHRQSAELSVAFPDIDWAFLQDVYGWAALQWQGWARGSIHVQPEDARTLVLHAEGVLEYWVDDVHYFGGDYYASGRAPVVLKLEPGDHTIDIRLVRDVRAFGGVGEPSIDVKLELTSPHGDPLSVTGTLMSDVVGGEFGSLASPYASVDVRNDAETTVYVHGIEGMRDVCKMELLSSTPLKLVPGQTRPVGFRLACVPPYNQRMDFQLFYRIEGSEEERRMDFATSPRRLDGIEDPQKITFLHPGGVVSYAILRPPSKKARAKCGKERKLPVLMALHGSGVEADGEDMRHVLDAQPDLCAWVIFPTGTSPWCGDDWHIWGFADVEAAVAAIPNWIEQVQWNGPDADTDRWIVMGHSNGGQGAWYVLTHWPDRVIAATPLSGYSSIQNYVPYTFWRTTDHSKMALVQAALGSYRHELLLENAKDIPIFQQHGDQDDNVPVYHSRMLSQRIQEAGAESTYLEVAGKPHYWDGIMSTAPLHAFLEKQIALANADHGESPPKSQDFSLVTANPGDTGSKNGVHILQLRVPGQLGRIEVSFDAATRKHTISTKNISKFSLPPAFHNGSTSVHIDGQVLPDLLTTSPPANDHVILTRQSQTWHASPSSSSSLPPRQGRQLGALDALLSTHGAFSIVQHTRNSRAADHISLQISRNLAQYFSADSLVTTDYPAALAAQGNIISVAVGADLPSGSSEHDLHPIQIHPDHVSIRQGRGPDLYRYPVSSARGLAAVYLRPLPRGRLELVVWGADEASLDVAARLAVPTLMTGAGVPDFVVADGSMLASGLDGVRAMGFFDDGSNDGSSTGWGVSSNSVL